MIEQNPCDDRRHFNIWSPNKSCSNLPQLLILGPQKTGSTALHFFLSTHPLMISSKPSRKTFEEVQFFSGKNYYKGLDWYLKFFELPESMKNNSFGKANIVQTNDAQEFIANGTHSLNKNFARIPPPFREGAPYFFEKSSTYFDGENTALRVHSLLPHAKLVIILTSPLKRAYSWYQHMKARNSSVALNFTFNQVITLNVNSQQLSELTMKKLKDLRNRCLNPGTYATHLERWLAYFPSQQVRRLFM